MSSLPVADGANAVDETDDTANAACGDAEGEDAGDAAAELVSDAAAIDGSPFACVALGAPACAPIGSSKHRSSNLKGRLHLLLGVT